MERQEVGTLGGLGCFSFQNGKALTCGEGGAILGHDEKLMDRCFSFHSLGRPHGSVAPRNHEGHPILASKCRMAEYQASILITQMDLVSTPQELVRVSRLVLSSTESSTSFSFQAF